MITGRLPTQLPNLEHQATFHQPHFRLEISLWLSTSTLSPPALDDFFLFSNDRKNLFFVSWLFLFVFHKLFRVHFWIWVIFDQVGLVRCCKVHSNIWWSFERDSACWRVEIAEHSRNFDFGRLLRFKCVSMFNADLQVGVSSTQVKILTMHWNYSNSTSGYFSFRKSVSTQKFAESANSGVYKLYWIPNCELNLKFIWAYIIIVRRFLLHAAHFGFFEIRKFL